MRSARIVKKIFIFFILALIISCQQDPVIVKEEETIKKVDLSLSINNQSEDIEVYHIYLKNISDNARSYAVNNFDLTNDLNISLFPGVYSLYSYGLIDKTETSKKVFSYSIIENIEFFQNKKIKLSFKILNPDVLIEYDYINDKVFLKVFMNDLYGFFTVSSISIKQGSDRVRSLDFIKLDNIYLAEVPLYENGEWFLNISYSLLSSKINKSILDNDNIYLSTSYFKDILLGEFNFL